MLKQFLSIEKRCAENSLAYEKMKTIRSSCFPLMLIVHLGLTNS